MKRSAFREKFSAALPYFTKFTQNRGGNLSPIICTIKQKYSQTNIISRDTSTPYFTQHTLFKRKTPSICMYFNITVVRTTLRLQPYRPFFKHNVSLFFCLPNYPSSAPRIPRKTFSRPRFCPPPEGVPFSHKISRDF